MNHFVRRAVPATGAILLTLGGCAIQPDSGPRDVPDDHPSRIVIGTAVEGAEAQGSGRIYLLAPDDSDGRLRTVLRSPEGQEGQIETLIRGPNPDEISAGLDTAVPVDLDVNSVRFEGSIVNVDVTDEIDELSDTSLQLAVAQIVFTASELPGADSVFIRVDGDSRAWPDGDGELRTDPLTTYDFIGYAESSQPAYPVTPRGASTTTAPPATTATPAPTTAA